MTEPLTKQEKNAATRAKRKAQQERWRAEEAAEQEAHLARHSLGLRVKDHVHALRIAFPNASDPEILDMVAKMIELEDRIAKDPKPEDSS